MKNFVLIISITFAGSLWSNPYNCEPLLDQGNTIGFVECIKAICASAETDAQIKSCIKAIPNQISGVAVAPDPPTLYTKVDNKIASYENEVIACKDDSECPASEGKGCYESAPDQVFAQGANPEFDKMEFVRVLSLFTGRNPESLADGNGCQRDSDCQSFYCNRIGALPQAPGQCQPSKFCRKALFGEVAAGPVKCDEGLNKDEGNKCRTPSFMENRSREIVRMQLNKTNTNVCNPDDPYANEFFDRLKSNNFHLRTFETLFADINTGGPFKIQKKLRVIAKDLRTKRLELVKKLNEANNKFKNEFLVINTLKATSDAVINFRGQDYVESDLYAKSIENGIALDLMTDLENIRADYNKELAKLYLETSDKFPPIIDAFIKINGNSKPGLFKLKKKKQWYYRVKLKSGTKKYLEEFQEGETLKILSQLYPQYSAMGLISDNAELKDFPWLGKSYKKERWLTWFPKRERFDNIPGFLKSINGTFQSKVEKEFKGTTHTTWDDLIDPELRFYTGCYSPSQTTPEDKQKSYCGQNELTMKVFQSHFLAHMVLYGSNGPNKHYTGQYFTGEASAPNQTSSGITLYNIEGPRGNYLRLMYEKFLLNGEAYQSLVDLKDERIACLNKHRLNPNPSGTLYSKYNEYNPEGYIYNGATKKLVNTIGSGNGPKSPFDTKSGTNLQLNKINKSKLDKASALSTAGSSTKLANSSDKSQAGELAKVSKDSLGNTSYSSYTQEGGSYQPATKAGAGFDWDDEDSPGFQVVNSAGSSLSTEEAKHVMKNLNNYEAPPPAQNTIFENISNSYVHSAYPSIFSE